MNVRAEIFRDLCFKSVQLRTEGCYKIRGKGFCDPLFFMTGHMGAGEENAHGLVLDHGFGRVSDNGCSGGYISGNDSAHAYNCASTYF